MQNNQKRIAMLFLSYHTFCLTNLLFRLFLFTFVMLLLKTKALVDKW
jgi:hypothetical protein